jgi:predicted DNA-binding transcriptional regulator AlpA
MQNLESKALDVSNGQRGHTKPKRPAISLHEPGRLRVANLMALLGVSHSTLYQRIRTGDYPKPDGYDGKFPFWKTSTIKQFIGE